MPIIRGININLMPEDVLSRQGFGENARLKAVMQTSTRELLDTVAADGWLAPAIAYEILPVGKEQEKKSLADKTVWPGSGLPPVLAGAKEVAVVVCTIGSTLEKQVRYFSENGEALRALLLDGIGSAAVDKLAGRAEEIIRRESAARHYRASSAVNPGMPGLPITAQPRLLARVPAGEIGVTLSASGTLVPLKSVSMIIGLGQDMPTWTRNEVCAACHLRDTCHYRTTAKTSHTKA
jgi:hypothetical protein